MKKLLALVLAAMMALTAFAAMADEGSEPDWTTFNELIPAIKAETDTAKRVELMRQAEDMIMDTGAVLPLYHYNDIYMAKPDFTGYYSNAFGTKFFMHAQNGGKTTARLCLASEPAYLDPALNSSVDGAVLAANAFGGLYTYDENGQYAPNFATKYEVSEDGLTYVFTMREGLKWSDGTPLTAKDFEYSWKRAADPMTAADYSYMLSGIDGYPDNLNVKASEDGTTFTVVLSAPCPYMLDLAAFPTFYAVKQEAVEAAKDWQQNPGAWALEAGFVSSGAFMLESWEHEQSMVYVKNPNYWDAENVKLERLEFMLSADDVAIYAAYANGDLDFIDNVPNDMLESLMQSDEFHVVDQLGTYYVAFNVKSPLFDGKTVEEAANMRKAFARLIDRQYIIDTVGQTGQQMALHYIPTAMADGNGGLFEADHPGYYPAEVDTEGAIELLKSAGYKFDDNGMLSAETPITFEYLTNSGSAHVAIAECIQQDLAMVGINMTIKNIEWNVFLEERKSGNFDIAREGWIADFNDPINMLEMWLTDSGNNDCQFGR